MKIDILTLFPSMFDGFLNTSIIKRARDLNKVDINVHNFRDYSTDKHGRVDDYPYGGGAGMLMQAEPVYLSYKSIEEKVSELTGKKPKVLYMTPQGKVCNQRLAEEYAQEEDLVFLCGHYEGIDERVLEMIVDENVSIGDYVLTGGELPAMVIVDTISRLVEGVLNNDDSAKYESFADNRLEYPQYTRPEEFMGKKVPEVLLSGDHKKVEQWREEQSLKRTLERRPDLLKNT